MIYLDHAATTPPDPDVLDRMTVTAREAWGNPSSPHAAGRRARAAIDASRRMMADMIGVEPQEIVFVASGSEGNTLALRGVCDRWMEERGTPGHLILLAIEHHCSLKPLARLRKEGWRVTLLPVDPDGILRYALYHDLGVGRSVAETLRVLEALQTGELCPMDWSKGGKTLGKA